MWLGDPIFGELNQLRCVYPEDRLFHLVQCFGGKLDAHKCAFIHMYIQLFLAWHAQRKRFGEV